MQYTSGKCKGNFLMYAGMIHSACLYLPFEFEGCQVLGYNDRTKQSLGNGKVHREKLLPYNGNKEKVVSHHCKSKSNCQAFKCW